MTDERKLPEVLQSQNHLSPAGYWEAKRVERGVTLHQFFCYQPPGERWWDAEARLNKPRASEDR